MHRYMIAFGANSLSQAMDQLLTEKDDGQTLYADSAYTGEDQEAVYKKKKVINKIIEKGYRNKPLGTNSQQQREIQDTCKGRTRVWLCRKQYAWLHCPYFWGCKRESKNRMMNLTYNICRCTQLKIVIAMG